MKAGRLEPERHPTSNNSERVTRGCRSWSSVQLRDVASDGSGDPTRVLSMPSPGQVAAQDPKGRDLSGLAGTRHQSRAAGVCAGADIWCLRGIKCRLEPFSVSSSSTGRAEVGPTNPSRDLLPPKLQLRAISNLRNCGYGPPTGAENVTPGHPSLQIKPKPCSVERCWRNGGLARRGSHICCQTGQQDALPSEYGWLSQRDRHREPE